MLTLDYAAVEAYDAAIERFENDFYKNKFSEFKNDHKEHIKKICEFLEKQKEDHPENGGIKKILTQGKVILAKLMGDIGILRAMKSNVIETTNYYGSINLCRNIPTQIKKALLKGYEDEKKHLSWIEHELKGE